MLRGPSTGEVHKRGRLPLGGERRARLRQPDGEPVRQRPEARCKRTRAVRQRHEGSGLRELRPLDAGELRRGPLRLSVTSRRAPIPGLRGVEGSHRSSTDTQTSMEQNLG